MPKFVPLDRTQRRPRLLALTALCALPALWLLGVAAFRVAGARAGAARPASRPPAALRTAEDYLAQGDYDFDRGDYEQAIADYSQAIALRPAFAEAYNNRAYTYMKREQYDRALPDLDEALRLRPDYVNALMNRGDVHNYYYRIDRSLALRDYDRVLALAPGTGSLCGHRLLAAHEGWSPGVLGELVAHGTAAGCTDAPAH
jgi:tetratricopeptide (TPR) repeat protein